MSKIDYCTPPPHVVTYPTLAIVLAVLVSSVSGFGSFVYAQARDAGDDGVEAAKKVDMRVDALTLVVAENQRAQARATAEIQSDIKALSMQLVTGQQPAQLVVDGGSP